MLEEMFKWSVNYGLGIVLSMCIAVAAWRLLVFVLKENSKREDRLAGIIEVHIGKLDESVKSIASALRDKEGSMDEFKEANRMQREEHKEIVLKLYDLGKIMENVQRQIEFDEKK